MKRLYVIPLGALGLAMALAGCSDSGRGDDASGSTTWMPPTSSGDGDGDGDSSGGSDGSGGDGDGDDSGGDRFDVGGGDNPTGCGDLGCQEQIDLLFVIDNSGTMAEEQLNLAQNFPLLIQKLEDLRDSADNPVAADVNIMVTTSDFGNPSCDPYKEAEPEKGKPVYTPCTDRLDRFTWNTMPPTVAEDACTQVCTTGARPDDQFINFTPTGSNVQGGTPADALSCLGPQGIDGCGYEAPLENMLQGLFSGACWNDPDSCSGDAEWGQFDKPFLRPDATLGIVIVTDEADCSVKEFSIMTDPNFQEVDPDDGARKQSSAICWNAGVACDGPDANGVYTNCRATDDGNMQPISRYTNYLIDEIRERQNKEVIMLGILGVPLVTAHSEEPPFQPTAGGVFDLVYRDWIDGAFPAGDILPGDAAEGVDAEKQEWAFGIGPGCTGEDGMGGFTGQAVPPVRIKEVCEALDYEDANGDLNIRCCIESICDTDFSAAINCLTGIISESIPPPG